jgi:hypothetical protein
MVELTREQYRQGRGGMYTFVKAVITSLIIKGERRKFFHLTPLSVAKIL